MTFTNAKANCKDKFGSENHGRLFEPKSLQMNQLVFEASLKVLGFRTSRYRFLGVDDLSTEGTFVYSSDSSQIAFPIPWAPGDPNGFNSSNCILVGYRNTDRWIDALCRQGQHSICEMVNKNNDIGKL